jgi:hypothetical protein
MDEAELLGIGDYETEIRLHSCCVLFRVRQGPEGRYNLCRGRQAPEQNAAIPIQGPKGRHNMHILFSCAAPSGLGLPSCATNRGFQPRQFMCRPSGPTAIPAQQKWDKPPRESRAAQAEAVSFRKKLESGCPERAKHGSPGQRPCEFNEYSVHRARKP